MRNIAPILAIPFVALLWSCLWPCLTARSQTPAKPHAEVRLDDGSIVRVSLHAEAIPVSTKFGKLLVPIADVRRIEFGLNAPPEAAAAISRAVKRLASPIHKERVAAGDDLVAAGHFAAPALRLASKSADLETSARARLLLAKLADNLSPDLMNLPALDTIHTTEMPIVGRVEIDAIKATSPHLGEIALRVSGMRSLRIRVNGDRTDLVLDAAKHGSQPDQWCDTGVVFERAQRMTITADGHVELWPQGPGQYVATPKGYNTVGRGGSFNAGALIAKVGDGKAFAVGERFDGHVNEEGRLYLLIVPSPWNNASSGSYSVKILSGR